MAMHRRDYIELLDDFRKNSFMRMIFLLISDGPKNLDNNQLVDELADICNVLDPVMVKTKNGKSRPDPYDILQHLFIKIKNEKAPETIISSVMYEGDQIDISAKKLRKFVAAWKLLRLVLANSIAARRTNSKKYYASIIRMFLVNQIR